MGEVDYVYVSCPECNGRLTLLSRVDGNCYRNFNDDNAPLDVMQGLLGGNEWCEHCGIPLKIEIVNKPVLRITRRE